MADSNETNDISCAGDSGRIDRWPDPTQEMLETGLFDTIWRVIKTWDINVPHAYGGYCGATGNHARAIYDAVSPYLREQQNANTTPPVSVQVSPDTDPAIEPESFVATEDEVWEITSTMASCGEIRGLPLPDRTKQALAAVLGKQYAARAAAGRVVLPNHRELAVRALKYRDDNFPPRGSPVGYSLLTEIASALQTTATREDDRALLIWALSFFARYGADCDAYTDAPRGAWAWSELFTHDASGEAEVEPELKKRLDDELMILGINHEVIGGCYTWGLPMKLFRRAAEVLQRTGDISQFSDAQKKRFQTWLWTGGEMPSLSDPETSEEQHDGR